MAASMVQTYNTPSIRSDLSLDRQPAAPHAHIVHILQDNSMWQITATIWLTRLSNLVLYVTQMVNILITTSPNVDRISRENQS